MYWKMMNEAVTEGNKDSVINHINYGIEKGYLDRFVVEKYSNFLDVPETQETEEQAAKPRNIMNTLLNLLLAKGDE